MRGKRPIYNVLVLALILLAWSIPAHANTVIGRGVLHVLGIGLSVDPSEQTAPTNTATAVNTNLIIPNIPQGLDVVGMPQDLLVVAELTGPVGEKRGQATFLRIMDERCRE